MNSEQHSLSESLRSINNLQADRFNGFLNKLMGTNLIAEQCGAGISPADVHPEAKADIHSYITGDKVYGVYLASDENIIKGTCQSRGHSCQ